MKKGLTILSILVFGLFFANSAWATTFTLPQSVLLDTTNFVDLDGPAPYTPNSGSEVTRAALGVGALYTITLDGLSGWSDIQIGDGFDHPSDNAGLTVGGGALGGDLTGYSAYSLVISNPNVSPWFMANITMNTGWTDIGETDTFYDNGWEWIAPGTSKVFSIDLSTVLNLNHVSQIGFKVGANTTGDEGWNPFDWENDFKVQVDPIPEPATMLLLGSGLVGLAGVRRKFKK